MATTRQDAWTDDEDLLLAEVVLILEKGDLVGGACMQELLEFRLQHVNARSEEGVVQDHGVD